MSFIKNVLGIFRRKDNYDIDSIEKKYLTITDRSKIFGFQEKFKNQYNFLFKVFGSADLDTFNKVKLIVITDTHNFLDENELVKLLNDHPEYDLCLLLGDHSNGDVEKVLNHIDKDKIYALLGNHDNDYIKNYNLNSLNGNVIEVKGVKLLGIQGSFKYKPVDFPSFTQEDGIAFLNDREKVDILVSHDSPFDDEKINNPAHQGLFGITYYLFKNKVKYNIHGHLHEPYRKQLVNGTTEISLYGINYIELD